MISPGVQLLRSRYRVVEVPIVRDEISETWIGADEEDSEFLIKLWPYEGGTPDNLHRALWDAELRTLYRLGSSPGAEDTMLVIKDAGVDGDAHCFVMVLEGRGYEPLANSLRSRSQHPWLTTSDQENRARLWSGLLKIGQAVRLLHGQRVIHRNVRAEGVFFNPEIGVSSLRLGGFEWSVRLGVPAMKNPPSDWSSPPEFFSGEPFGYRPETDWFAYGMLVGRCLLNMEPFANMAPVERHKRVLSEIERSSRFSDLERLLLLRIIAQDPKERLTRTDEILTGIGDIVAALERVGGSRQDEMPLVLVIDSRDNQVIDYAQEMGFVPNADKPDDAFNPFDILHEQALTSFLQGDLQNGRLYAPGYGNFYLLVGSRLGLVLKITKFRERDPESGTTTLTWDLAFCPEITELRSGSGMAARDLPRGAVVVRTFRQLNRARAIRQNTRSWEPYLPHVDRTERLRANLARFHEFIRCTNQLELLIRDSEIFRYALVSKRRTADGVDSIVIKETPRERPELGFCRVEGGLSEFLHREIESNKPDCDLVVLTHADEDGFNIPRVEKKDRWKVLGIDRESRHVELQRVASEGRDLAANEGHVRTWGMFGQVELIRRRKRAIDRIEEHSYLLRSLSAPGQVYMDTGLSELPVPLPSNLVDDAKQAAIRDILRVRPIYALQGPPGTGKTTLVAHLLRQILEDDPVAQVLITAQAHGAVDVLRAKVRNEAFQDIPEAQLPLAVRLGLPINELAPEEGTVEQVSKEILEKARGRLVGDLTALQKEWVRIIDNMIAALKTLTAESGARDFCEVVKRGANVTYCTTSAGDLEALAEATQSFDWAIVEEAGKAHGFDLALPLQAGHRSLLIGDHKQLPPYRFKDYRDGIDFLDQSVEALKRLPDRDPNLVDSDWIRSWEDQDQAERAEFKEYARRWLTTFERVFEASSSATGTDRRTVEESDGAAAGMLWQQHRMHPHIGDLISVAYYDGQLVNQTLDSRGEPLARVVHPFVAPEGLRSKTIVWLDLPSASRDPRAAERGPDEGYPRYTNPAEVAAMRSFMESLRVSPEFAASGEGPALTLAVLSPYNQQVGLINRTLSEPLALPPKVVLTPTLRSRANETRRLAHTVDSFQGNQADVIIVSLVRNNTKPAESGLGFLDEAGRLNVLLSRAERLLVLVGSWEFFSNQLIAVPLDDSTFPLWHWKKVMTTLEEWFQSGRALRMSARFEDAPK